MARITNGELARRVLGFLHGLNDPRAGCVLAASGFTNDDLDEGWRLLRELKAVHITKAPACVNPRTLADLDEWENRWFAICKVTLQRHHPEVHDRVFAELAQQAGVDVISSVSTFLERIAELDEATDSEPMAARRLLEARGLRSNTIAEAKCMLESLSAPSQRPPPFVDTPELQAEREAALFGWYQEWAAIAQTTIRDRNVLRGLGIGEPKRAGHSDDEDAFGYEANDDHEAPPMSRTVN
jgi:hypothetical protein